MVRLAMLALSLLGLSFARPASADEPASPAPSTPQQIRETIERAIGYEQAESADWMSTRQCAACHHLPTVLWSLNEAERYGYLIDKRYVTDMAETNFGNPEMLISSKLIPGPNDPPDPRPLGKGVRVATAFIAVAAYSYPTLTERQLQAMQTIIDGIIEKQRDDGGWDFFLRRPPINESETTDAAWIIMALHAATGPDSSDAQRAALEKALAWWNGTELPDNLQDKNFKLLLGLRTSQSRDSLQPTIDEILALQQPAGGWRQNLEMPTDAFATGQTLYALALAGFTAEQPEIKRAIDFLVATQQADGSWPMTSRSTPDGSPGSSTLLTPIQCATSSWVVLALSRLVPNGP